MDESTCTKPQQDIAKELNAYRKTSNTRRTLVRNKIADHSNVVLYTYKIY